MQQGQEITPLTDEERVFAEESINVVYRFLSYYKLDRREYYDIVIFGYLKAVRLYCEREELHQYSFATIAYRQMSVSLRAERQYRNAMSRKSVLPEIRLDEKCPPSDITKHEVYTTVEDFADELVIQLYWERILCKLTPKDQELIDLLLQGNSMSDIAALQGVSRQNIHKKMCRIREKLMAN